jgi:hypothetical protein
MNNIIEKGIKITQAFLHTLAFGISGSFAQNKTDTYSDYDFCVFTKGGIPELLIANI